MSMGSEQNRFPQQERRKRWVGCLRGLSCFRTQKGGKRIVPASRIPDGSATATHQNGPPAVGTIPSTTLVPSLLAPPSSPASFTNSALPSTAQSPSCYLSLSANSPGGPSSTMFATGPYAHETQLVSPPVFSTFTTEPSTAPFTPPPELAHLTTPSSPDVPFAKFLSSSMDLKRTGKSNYIGSNDLQATYSLYPGSPASSLISPISRASGDCLSASFPERDFPHQWDISPQNGKYSRTGSGRLLGIDTPNDAMLSQDSNFFCPATFAQFYLDQSQPPYPHSGGRLSLPRELDVYPSAGNVQQIKQNKNCKQDVEELEAYRASFGFSADEIVTTGQYVEISDGLDVSFSMSPFSSNKPPLEESTDVAFLNTRQRLQVRDAALPNEKDMFPETDSMNEGSSSKIHLSGNNVQGPSSHNIKDANGSITSNYHMSSDEDDIFAKMRAPRLGRKYHMGSSSDAEVDYRRVRSLREGRGAFVSHHQ